MFYVCSACLIETDIASSQKDRVSNICCHCSPEKGFTREEPCPQRRCRHGGWCDKSHTGRPVCRCKGSYTGPYCDDQVNMCTLKKPCQHGGACVFLKEGYKYVVTDITFLTILLQHKRVVKHRNQLSASLSALVPLLKEPLPHLRSSMSSQRPREEMV